MPEQSPHEEASVIVAILVMYTSLNLYIYVSLRWDFKYSSKCR